MNDYEHLKAFEYNDQEIKDVDDPSEEFQLAAIGESEFMINYIKNPTEKVQMAAIEPNYFILEYFLVTPCEKVQLHAVNQDPFNLQYIEEQYESAQLLAIKLILDDNDDELFYDDDIIELFSYIKNPTDKVKKEIFKFKVSK